MEGDQLAVRRPTWKPGVTPSAVTGIAFDPSGEETQISDSPERFDRKATRSPSGDRLGMPSNLVDPIRRYRWGDAGAPGEGMSTRQMLASAKLRTYSEPLSSVSGS